MTKDLFQTVYHFSENLINVPLPQRKREGNFLFYIDTTVELHKTRVKRKLTRIIAFNYKQVRYDKF